MAARPRRQGVALALTAALLAGGLPGAARAEVYEFDNFVVQGGQDMIQALYIFYVFGDEEDTSAKDTSTVEFRGVVANSTCQGLQVSLFPFKDFWKLVNKTSFCSTSGKLMLDKTKLEASEKLIHTRDITNSATDFKETIKMTAAYSLVVSSCGDCQWTRLNGAVAVHSSHGYLPANKIYKLSFFRNLSFFYVGFLITWVVLACAWKFKGGALTFMFFCVFGILVLGILETASWWRFLSTWNESGDSQKGLLLVAMTFTALKPSFAYAIMLAVGLGLGLMTTDIPDKTLIPAQFNVVASFWVNYSMEVVQFARHGYDISSSALGALLCVQALVHACLFCWILSALGTVQDKLSGDRERNLFSRVRCIFACAVVFGFLNFCGRLLDLSPSLSNAMFQMFQTDWWYFQWFGTDGAHEVIFATVLVAIAALWAPQHNYQAYAYTEHIELNDDEKDAEEVPSADTFAVGDDDDEDNARGSTVVPQRIGAVDGDSG